MIVYHGTDEKGYIGIINDGFISVTNDTNKRYDSTRTGYIYVTSDLFQAIDFSTRPQRGIKEYPVIVFEIEINELQLQRDIDEEEIDSTLSEDGFKKCYVINKNLFIGQDVKRLLYKYFCDAKEVGSFMQKVQYNEVEIKDSEWELL